MSHPKQHTAHWASGIWAWDGERAKPGPSMQANPRSIHVLGQSPIVKLVLQGGANSEDMLGDEHEEGAGLGSEGGATPQELDRTQDER